MESYETVRQRYRPASVVILLIAESPPPDAKMQSSRHFYRTDHIRRDDRLFVNTLRALYPETESLSEEALEQQKESWLRRFQQDGYYMIEALEASQPHEVSKKDRQAKITGALPRLIERVRELAGPHTKLILIKSNVFEAAAEPLRAVGFAVLNTELLDYPGRFNQRAYREKLAHLAKQS